jgi:tRNA threonylcarbamoyladenosine biosynthesis protein TsaE
MSTEPLILTLPDVAAADTLGVVLGVTFPGAVDGPDGAVDGPDGPVDGPVLLFLRGELGAGKTTVARSLLHALGVRGTVRSPTYTLVETYEARGLQCAHVDLYRLRDATELEDLGLRDLLAPGYLVLIEWPERGAGWLPTPDLEIVLGYHGTGREASVFAGTAAGSTWLGKLAHDTRIVGYLPNLT